MSRSSDAYYIGSTHPLYVLWNNMKHNRNKFGSTIWDGWRRDRIKFFKWALDNGWTTDMSAARIDDKLDFSPDNTVIVKKVDSAKIRGRRPNAHLKPDDIKEIRERLQSGDRVVMIARDYGITQSAIYAIKNRKSWVEF